MIFFLVTGSRFHSLDQYCSITLVIMFALLNSSARSTNSSLNIVWERSTNVQAKIMHNEAFLPSILDKLAAPTVFMQQALVYPDGLNWDRLRESIQLVVDNAPVLGARLNQQDGQLQLFNHAQSGITLMQGSMPNMALQQLLAGVPIASSKSNSRDEATATGATFAAAQPPSTAVSQQQQSLVVLPDLPDALFSHLPGALTPDYIDSPELALVQIAVVQLAGGGSVLGLRMSHLLGDWGSARLLLRSIAAAYSRLTAQQEQQQSKHGCGTTELQLQGSEVAKTAAACKDSCSATANNSSNLTTSGRGLNLPEIASAALLLNTLVLHCRQQLPDDYSPIRLKPLGPADQELFTKLAQLSSTCCSDGDGSQVDTAGAAGSQLDKACAAGSCSTGEKAGNRSDSTGQPQRLTYHVLPSRIQQLKNEAAACAPAAGVGGESSGASLAGASKAFTSHNVLLARVVKAFCSLPGRSNLPHDIAISVDMRSKVPAVHLSLIAQQRQQQEQQQRQELQPGVHKALEGIVGNFFGTAIVEDCVAGKVSLGQLAQQVASAINRSSDMWLPDLAWASAALGISAAELAGQDCTSVQQQLRQPDQQSVAEQGQLDTTSTKQQVTWRRLHAMGPRKMLQQQMTLGLLASLSTSQWPLQYAEDATMAGQLPVLAVPGFSQPQPYPLVIMQPAPDAMGKGVLVHIFLDGCEILHMQQAVEALGGL